MAAGNVMTEEYYLLLVLLFLRAYAFCFSSSGEGSDENSLDNDGYDLCLLFMLLFMSAKRDDAKKRKFLAKPAAENVSWYSAFRQHHQHQHHQNHHHHDANSMIDIDQVPGLGADGLDKSTSSERIRVGSLGHLHNLAASTASQYRGDSSFHRIATGTMQRTVQSSGTKKDTQRSNTIVESLVSVGKHVHQSARSWHTGLVHIPCEL